MSTNSAFNTLVLGSVFLGTLFASSILCAESLAGRTFNRTAFTDFASYEDSAGLTYNPLTQSYFMTDNDLDVIVELSAAGTPLRSISIAGLKATGLPLTDAEGITWMYGQTYALVSEDAEELLVVRITPTTQTIARAQATIYKLFGQPKGITYKSSENAWYWVSEKNPMRLVKSKLNPSTGQFETLLNIDVTALPATNLADVAYFPRLSPYMLLLSDESKKIMEVDVTGGAPILKSTFALNAWPIPQAGAVAFGADGTFRLVSKNAPGPEDNFNVFTPTAPIANLAPVARITRGFGS